MPSSSHGTLTIYTNVDTKGLDKGLNGIVKTVNQLSNMMSFAVGIAGVIKLGKSAIEAASDLQEYRNVAEVTFGSMIGKLDDLIDISIEAYGMSRLTATQAASGFMAMGNAAGIAKDKASDMAVGLTKYMGDFASFYNLSQERARTALAAVYTGETETLKQYGIMLQEVNLQQYENEYGLGRSIKTMTAAEKAQLRYNYIMHVGADAIGDFARTSGNWANQTRVLSERWNEFLVMLGNGLITVLTPAVRVLNQLIDVTMRYTKTLGDAIAVIFGIEWQDLAEQQKAAADVADEFAESEEDANKQLQKSAKSASRALQPFDKLNNLRSAATAGTKEEEVDTDKVEDSANRVENATGIIQSSIDSLYKLGQYLALSLQKTLDSIQWDQVYERLSSFGTGLAEFLNGALSVESLSSVATTLANSLNAIFTSALSFADEFDWTALGTSIADSLNTFFLEFDGEQLADAINTFVDGLKQTLVTAIQETDWSMIKEEIKKFFRTLDIDTITILVGAITIPKLAPLLLRSITTAFAGGTLRLGLSGLFNGIFSGGLLNTGDFVGNLIDSFKLAFGGAGTLSESIKTMFGPVEGTMLGIVTSISGVVLAVTNFITMLQDGFSWFNEILMLVGIAIGTIGAIMLGAPAAVASIVGAIVAAIATAVVVIVENWDKIKEFFLEVWEKIEEVWTNVSTWFNENIITPVVDFFETAVEDISTFFSDLWEGIKEVWSTVSEWFNTNIIEPVASFFEGLVTRIGQFFEGCWIIIQAVWIIVSEWFNDNVIEPLVEFFEPIVDEIGDFFSDLWEDIKGVWEVVSGWFSEHVTEPVGEFFGEAVESIAAYFTDLWKDIKDVWTGVSSWFQENVVDQVTDMWETACESIGEFFSTLWYGIKLGVVSAMNGVIEGVESALNWVIDGINDLIRGFNNIVAKAGNVIGVTSGGIDYVPNVNFSRIPIPALAQGAVIPPNKQFLAMLGDQRHGTNVEAPLDTIKQALVEALQSVGYSGDNGDIVIKIGEEEVFRAVRRQSDNYFNRTGREAFSH